MNKIYTLLLLLLFGNFSYAQVISSDSKYFINYLDNKVSLSKNQKSEINKYLVEKESILKSIQEQLGQLKDQNKGNSPEAKNLKKEIQSVSIQQGAFLDSLFNDEQRVIYKRAQLEKKANHQLEQLNQELTLVDSQKKLIVDLIVDSNLKKEHIKLKRSNLKKRVASQESDAISPSEEVKYETILEKEEIEVVNFYESSMKKILTDKQFKIYQRLTLIKKYQPQVRNLSKTVNLVDSQKTAVLDLLIDIDQKEDSLTSAILQLQTAKKNQENQKISKQENIVLTKSKKRKKAKKKAIIVNTQESSIEEKSKQIASLQKKKSELKNYYENSIKKIMSIVQNDLYNTNKTEKSLIRGLRQLDKKIKVSETNTLKLKDMLVSYVLRRKKLNHISKNNEEYNNLEEDLQSIDISLDNELLEIFTPEELTTIKRIFYKIYKD